MFLYEVTATLKSEQACERYLAWLLEGHASALLSWAERAEVTRLDPTPEAPWRVKSAYLFQDREAYERYTREGAPALRAEGVALAESLGGVGFERAMGPTWRCAR